MTVRAGSWNDPETTEGLAHFCGTSLHSLFFSVPPFPPFVHSALNPFSRNSLTSLLPSFLATEHMLFLGTEKYPDEEAYSRFLREHSGNYNAFTAVSETSYIFEIGVDNLMPVLDMFAQFFIAPLFTESSVAREVEAIESEHQKDLFSNNWRLGRIDQLDFTKEHPNFKLQGGTAATLQKHADLRDQVMKFWSDNYSANIMTLAILGKESLDELEAAARDKFSAIQNKDLEVQNWKTPEKILKQTGTLTSVLPFAEARKIRLVWQFSPGWRGLEESKPEHYISHVLGHEAEGSLFATLKAKGWAEALMTGASNHLDYSYLSCSIDLTAEGIAHLEDVIEAVFAYIALMKRTGPSEVLFNELKMLGELAFRFMEKSSPFGFLMGVAQSVARFPIEKALSGNHLVSEFVPEKITEILQQMTPENVRVLLYAKEIADPKSPAHVLGNTAPNAVEEHYGIDYRQQPLSEATIKKWKSVVDTTLSDIISRWPGMVIPRPNPFLPDDLSLKPVPKDAPGPDEDPKIILDTPLLRLWHKQDQTFKRPSGCLAVFFSTPASYKSPKAVVLTKMLADYISDSLNELAYDAAIAGLSYSVTALLGGFEIQVSGYNCKQSLLLQHVLSRFRDLKTIDSERFELLRNKAIKNYKNTYFQQAYQLAIYQNSLHLDDPRWNVVQYEQMMAKITPAMVLEWMPQLLENIYIEILAMGNIEKEEALDVSKLILETFKESEELLPGQTPLLRAVQYDKKVQHWVQHVSANPEETNSAALNVYQLGVFDGDFVKGAIIELLGQLISTDAYDALRTKEQLGYIVFSFPDFPRNAANWQLLVQSAKHDPVYLDTRMEAWLATVSESLKAIPEEVFVSNQQALVAQKREKFTSLSKTVVHAWSHIAASRDYEFGLGEKMAVALESLTMKDIIVFWDEYLAPGAPQRAKMSIQVWPPAKVPHVPTDPAFPIDLISDAFDFKSTRPAFPVRLLPIPRKTSYKKTSAIHAPSSPRPSPKSNPESSEN